MVRTPRPTAKKAPAERTPAKKQGYHHGDAARALVSAAVELIATRGPDAFTLREVAAAIGITHAAAYRHFADKQTLLAAVAEDGYRALAVHLARAGAPGADPRSRLRSIAAAYVEFAMDRPAHYRVMWGPRLNEDGRFPALESAIGESFGLLIELFDEGQRKGVFRPGLPRDHAIAFWVTAHGYVELVLRRRIKVKSAKVAVSYFDALLEPFIDGMTALSRTAGREGGRAEPGTKGKT